MFIRNSKTPVHVIHSTEHNHTFQVEQTILDINQQINVIVDMIWKSLHKELAAIKIDPARQDIVFEVNPNELQAARARSRSFVDNLTSLLSKTLQSKLQVSEINIQINGIDGFPRGKFAVRIGVNSYIPSSNEYAAITCSQMLSGAPLLQLYNKQTMAALDDEILQQRLPSNTFSMDGASLVLTNIDDVFDYFISHDHIQLHVLNAEDGTFTLCNTLSEQTLRLKISAEYANTFLNKFELPARQKRPAADLFCPEEFIEQHRHAARKEEEVVIEEPIQLDTFIGSEIDDIPMETYISQEPCPPLCALYLDGLALNPFGLKKLQIPAYQISYQDGLWHSAQQPLIACNERLSELGYEHFTLNQSPMLVAESNEATSLMLIGRDTFEKQPLKHAVAEDYQWVLQQPERIAFSRMHFSLELTEQEGQFLVTCLSETQPIHIVDSNNQLLATLTDQDTITLTRSHTIVCGLYLFSVR